jgi:hypothetical protein
VNVNARIALLAVVVLAPFVAFAADLPVSYLVEDKPLKSIAAGTMLTFELYSDNTCTTLVHTAHLGAENVNLLTKLKQLTPKNGPKHPSTVELRTTLTSFAGVKPGDDLSLRVTSALPGAVVPVGGACQVQSARVSQAITPTSLLITFDGGRNRWKLMDPPAIGLTNPTYFLSMEPGVMRTLQDLNSGANYTCDLATVVSENFVGLGATYLPLYDIKNCN